MNCLGTVTHLALAASLLAACSGGNSGAQTFPPGNPPGATPGDASQAPASGGDPAGGGGSPGPLLDGPDAAASATDAAPAVPGLLTAIIRDFRLYAAGDPTTNPDFENPPFNVGNDGGPSPGYKGSWYDTEIVADALGSDLTPTYKNATGATLTTHGAASFQSWYHDTPGTNLHVEYPFRLQPKGNGVFGYDSVTDGVPYNVPGTTGGGFFPIDDGSPYQTAFGNQGLVHNYSFTMEIHTVFTYRGGEYFQFRGDDDVFVFIDKKLVINLGGVHDPQPAQVAIDGLGLVAGQTYPLDFFSAERHVYGSNIEFTTTLALQPKPAPK